MGQNPLVSFNWLVIYEKIRAHLKRISDSLGSGILEFTLVMDGTKVSKSKHIPQNYKAIMKKI